MMKTTANGGEEEEERKQRGDGREGAEINTGNTNS